MPHPPPALPGLLTSPRPPPPPRPPAARPRGGRGGARQRWPTVSVGPSDELLVWEDDVNGVFARRLDPAGVPGAPLVVAANDPLPTTLPFDVKVKEQHE